MPLIGYDSGYERAVIKISKMNKNPKMGGVAHFLSALIRIVYPCDIDHHAQLGKISIPHATGIVIGDSAVIEDDVLIMQNVTIGSRFGHDEKHGHAYICRGVLLGAGCAIIGRVTVGEYAKIGANAVITKDVPPYAVVVGNNHIVRIEKEETV